MTKRELAHMLGLRVSTANKFELTDKRKHEFFIGGQFFIVSAMTAEQAFDKASQVVIEELSFIIGDKFK
jgi:hypothetical protein